MSSIRDVLRVVDCRRILTGWFASLAGELAGTVALLVYAHDAGGAGLVAVYGVARTLPAIVITPAIVSASDRIAPDRMLRWTLAARAVLLAIAASGAVMGVDAAVVIGAAAIGSWLAGAYRPIQASAMPWLARTPGELTAANVVAAMAENAGTLVGPIVAGAALAIVGVPAAIGLAAGLTAIGLISIARLRVSARPADAPEPERAPLAAMAAGAVDLARLVPPAGVVVLVFGQTFLRGALNVLIVVLAIDELLLGEAAVGWLTAATGVGGLMGGAIAGAVLSVSRLARGFVGGLLLWGIPLVVLALVPHPVTAYLALIAVGVGNALEDVSLYTLMPRAFRPRFVGRALGALEFTVFAGVGIGSLAAPFLVEWLGALGGLGVMGAALSLLALVYATPFVRLDRRLPVPGPEAALLRRNPIFAPLPLATVELLATRLSEHRFGPGEVVMAEGETGDTFHLIAEGAAAVSIGNEHRTTLDAGEGFGEIALLRDVPRTATVRAVESLRTFSLPRREFLSAIGSSRQAAATAAAMAADRIGEDAAGRGQPAP